MLLDYGPVFALKRAAMWLLSAMKLYRTLF